MLDDIADASTRRVVEIREYLDFLVAQTLPPPVAVPRFINTGKGMIYVQLYGVIEFTVLAIVEKSIDFINQDDAKLNQISPFLMALALSPELDSLIHANTKKWQKRHDIFNKIVQNSIVNIQTTLLPTDGSNIQQPQLTSIWQTFDISEPIFHEVSFSGRLKDIVTNRINIAHGNSTASEVGANVTFSDLTSRIDEVSAFCSHIVLVFDDYIVKKKYRK